MKHDEKKNNEQESLCCDIPICFWARYKKFRKPFSKKVIIEREREREKIKRKKTQLFHKSITMKLTKRFSSIYLAYCDFKSSFKFENIFHFCYSPNLHNKMRRILFISCYFNLIATYREYYIYKWLNICLDFSHK